jgi:adenylate kinase family enzyme
VEDEKYDDRIFFMSTLTDASYIRNKKDISSFIRNYINNVPGKNICNIYSEYMDFDKINNFIVLKFTKQIQYGEHFKIVFMHNQTNTSNIVYEIIASNDIRLRYTKNNINPYISTNTPDDVTKNISYYTELYRITFYTQDLSNPDKVAPLSEQLKRI